MDRKTELSNALWAWNGIGFPTLQSLKRSVRTIIRRMIVTLQTERLHTVEQIRGFLDGNREVGFRSLDRDEAYDFVRRTLVRLNYDALGCASKGTVREFLGKATGCRAPR